MKRKTIAVILLLALLACAACTAQPGPEEGEYLLYFQTMDADHHGPALEGEPWSPAEPDAPVEAEELLRALLAGPTKEGLVSPFPRGVGLNRVEWESEGKLKVRLSEAYSGLSDIALTLADYSIVLTLSQLEGVESVEIQTVGYSSNYRSHQVLRAEEALISDPLLPEDSSP